MKEYILHEDKKTVVERETKEVVVEVPFTIEEEERLIEEIDKQILKLQEEKAMRLKRIQSGDAVKLEASVEEAIK